MENKIQNLEDELKVLKNEVQAVLVDIKDFLIVGGGIGAGAASFAQTEPSAGPFSDDGTPPVPQQIVIDQPTASDLDPDGEDIDQAGPSEDGMPGLEEGSESAGTGWGGPDVFSSGEAPVSADTGWKRSAASSFGDGDFAQDRQSAGTVSEEQGGDVDLPTLAIIAPWLSKAVAAVGKEQMRKLVEIYDVARSMPPRLKHAILLMLDLYGNDETGGLPSGENLVREGIPLLIELDSLLLRHRTGTFESAVLSLLQDRMTGNKKTRSRKG